MIKKIVLIIFIQSIQFNLLAQVTKQGLLVGINGSINKTNLYNKWDSRANEVGKELHYIKSYGNNYGLELGYFFGNGFSVFLNPALTNVNQKYEGSSTRFVAGDVKLNSDTSILKPIKKSLSRFDFIEDENYSLLYTYENFHFKKRKTKIKTFKGEYFITPFNFKY